MHTKFTKLQVLCIPSRLQTGLGGEKCTGVEPETVFEGGQERTYSEPNEQQSDKSDQNLQKVILLKLCWGQKSDIFDPKGSKLFCKNVLPTAGRSTFLKKRDAKSESEHKNYERGTLKLTLSMQLRNKERPA